jgi:hypothetical protein
VADDLDEGNDDVIGSAFLRTEHTIARYAVVVPPKNGISDP